LLRGNALETVSYFFPGFYGLVLQGLKPIFDWALNGTAEAVPFHNRIVKQLLGKQQVSSGQPVNTRDSEQ
jgi:hypothetical protein